MNTSSRFVVATHILAVLGGKEKYFPGFSGMNSDELAQSVNTNPVVIRRIIGQLKRAGLVISKTGPKGGTTIAKQPEKIKLADIYESVEEGDLFHLHYAQPNPICPVGGHIQDSLRIVFDEAQAVLRKKLMQFSLLDIINDTLKRAGILSGAQFDIDVERMQHVQKQHEIHRE